MENSSRQRLIVLIGIHDEDRDILSHGLIDKFGDNITCISYNEISLNLSNSFTHTDNQSVYKKYISEITTSLRLGYDVIANHSNTTTRSREIYFALKEAISRVDNVEIDIIGVCIDSKSDILRDNRYTSILCRLDEPEYVEGFKIIMYK